MAWKIEQQPDGTWDWSCANSAYGAAVGNAPTKAQAEDELYAAQTAMIGDPSW